MKKKQIKKALESNTPMNSMYALIPPERRNAFKKFAAMFGFSEENIKNILAKENGR
ncbi:MAG: hypothetical protein NC410_09040 [Oscillibacter sp.]|nr:hypothetical protein [Oscillibacter sp.]